MLQKKLDWLDGQEGDGFRPWYLKGRLRMGRNDAGYPTLEELVDARIQERRGRLLEHLGELHRYLAADAKALSEIPPTSAT
jgi:hypothetical protein